ncbi:MAG: cytochrome c oxidase assembly protein [Chloroflexota bacterium]|nr:cytochrome c oxidase assembly protein [Chloroflexota bacterium]
MVLLPLLHGAPATSTAGWWHWHLHPDVWLFCIVLEALYLYAVIWLRQSASDAGRVKRRQVLLFSGGVFTIWLAAGTPIHDIGEQYLLSVHMLEHTMLTFVAAPLLLAGIPSWLWQVPLRVRGVLPAARVLVHPIVILFVVNMTFVVLHLPAVLDLSLRSDPFHFTWHAVLVAVSILMWWPILSDVPELPRISYPMQMAYLFVQSLIPMVVASFITFADHAIYAPYVQAPRLWGLSPLADQQVAGGIMKTFGALVIWWFIGLAFFRWYRDSQAEEKGPRWSDVQDELDQLGLSHR